MDSAKFTLVGAHPPENMPAPRRRRWYADKPLASMFVLLVIVCGCLFSDLFIPKDPSYMDLMHCSAAPNGEFWFGTDTMGRDMFSMIWSGGRLSLFIGFAAALISTALAIVLGSLSGLAPAWLDALLMRGTDIFLSVPSLLLILFIQAIFGRPSALSLALVIGLTSWTSMAKVVRAEVRQLRSSEYVLAARCMGGGFWHVLWKHLTPNFVSSIMFMVVMNIRSAIVAESTLSFMGVGLPLEIISWGSMLSLSEKALLTNSWWILLIPGLFLVTTLLCVTGVGNYLRKRTNRAQRNL